MVTLIVPALLRRLDIQHTLSIDKDTIQHLRMAVNDDDDDVDDDNDDNDDRYGTGSWWLKVP